MVVPLLLLALVVGGWLWFGYLVKTMPKFMGVGILLVILWAWVDYTIQKPLWVITAPFGISLAILVLWVFDKIFRRNQTPLAPPAPVAPVSSGPPVFPPRKVTGASPAPTAPPTSPTPVFPPWKSSPPSSQG